MFSWHSVQHVQKRLFFPATYSASSPNMQIINLMQKPKFYTLFFTLLIFLFSHATSSWYTGVLYMLCAWCSRNTLTTQIKMRCRNHDAALVRTRIDMPMPTFVHASFPGRGLQTESDSHSGSSQDHYMMS